MHDDNEGRDDPTLRRPRGPQYLLGVLFILLLAAAAWWLHSVGLRAR